MGKLRLVPIAFIGIIGASGLSLLTASEGLHNNAYRDPVGITTICYGHTGPEVRMGMHLNDAQCAQVLLRDVQDAQRAIVPASPTSCLSGAPVTPNERDALTSLVFNIGKPKFCKSTLARKLAARDYIGGAREFPKWNKVSLHGRLVPLRGLTTRREAEQALFLAVDRQEAPEALSGRATALLTAPKDT